MDRLKAKCIDLNCSSAKCMDALASTCCAVASSMPPEPNRYVKLPEPDHPSPNMRMNPKNPQNRRSKIPQVGRDKVLDHTGGMRRRAKPGARYPQGRSGRV